MRRAVAALTLLAALAGCGSSYTRTNFIASADAICLSSVRATRAIPPPSFSGGSARELRALAGYLDRLLPIVKSEAAQIRALQHPSESTRYDAALAKYRTALSQEVSDYQALDTAARKGGVQAVASAEAALRASQVTALAVAYGLRSCGAPGATVS